MAVLGRTLHNLRRTLSQLQVDRFVPSSLGACSRRISRSFRSEDNVFVERKPRIERVKRLLVATGQIQTTIAGFVHEEPPQTTLIPPDFT
jgi:hypothetical protein